MRPLHRPMFRYGGPIKEGIMSGIREPHANGGRAALVGNPIFPKTNGRAHHEISYRFNPIKGNPLKVKDKIISTGVKEGVKKWAPSLEGIGGRTVDSFRKWWLRNRPTAKWRQPPIPKGQTISDKYIPAPYSKWEIARNPKLWWRAAKENPKTAIGMGYGATTDPGQAVIGGIPGALKWGAEVVTPGMWEKHLPWNKEKDLPPPPEGDGTTTNPWKEKYEALLEANKTPPKSDEQIRNERIQKYRDIMDIKGMNQEAAYKSLVDASKIIQESGDFKEDIKSGKLINDIIQATSKAYDKPSEMKKAIDTLILKGEIQKDIAGAKPTQYELKEDYLTGNLGAVTGKRVALGKPGTLSDALLLTKGSDTKTNRTSQALRAYFDGYLTPKFEGKLSADNIDALGGKEKLIEGETISLDNGVYQVSKGYILVDGNKIIKQEDLFTGKD